ncbi:helix-turn-helix transcriptional regulator [bacterium SCSIO 12643]|nr:helix-turn-helix transcriptional regulator [bacterium SCSIO 12643]
MIIKKETFDLSDKTVLGRLIFRPPFKASSALKNEARFVHVLNGTSKLHSPNSRMDLNPGDSVMMKCENFVNNWIPNDSSEPNEAIIIQIYPDILKLAYNDQIPEVFNSSTPISANPVEKIPPHLNMNHFITGLKHYLNHPSVISEELLKLKIRELIHLLLHTPNSGPIKSMLGDLFKTKDYAFKEIIQSNIYEDLNLSDLAFFAGLSLSSFKRKFNELYGMSPTKYIIGKRLEKAKKLLAESDTRISEIAYSCGFNDTGYFSKSFIRAFQYSPSNYRKTFQQNDL